jgi:glucose-6-phosphate isomerase
VLLATLLLIHRALWPLLTRTLFRMADIGTKGRRAILTAIGISLLGTSVFGEKFPELLKEFVKAFGG